MPPPRKNSSNGKTDREKKVAPAEKDVSADLQAEDAPMMAELGSEPPGLAADRVRSSSAEFCVEPIQTAVEEQIEPSNPSVNLDEQQAAMSSTENTESAETKLSEVDSEPDGLEDSSAEEVTDPPVRSLQTETVAKEAKETPAIIPDVSDPSAEVVKTADPEIPMRKKLKSFQVSTTSELVSPPGRGTDTLFEGPAEPEKLSTAPESGHAQDENKPLPPKRKSKGSELPLKSDAEKHQTKELPEVEGLASNNQTVVEETKLVPTRRKSKNGQVSIHLETLSQVNSQKSSNTSMAHPVTLAEENKAKLSPMQRKAKGSKQTAEPAAKDTGKTSKEPDSQQSLEKTEGKLTPVRRSKTSLAVIDLESKDARKEGKSRSISSATQGSALTAETTARKSQSPKISVKPSHKEEAKASGKKDETTAVEETELIPTSRRSKENETTVVDKGKLSPAKRKPKSLKPSKGFPTKESSSPKMNPDKAKSTVLDKGKLSPTKRKSKASKPSKELSTTELPMEKQEPLAPEMVKENPDITESAVEEMVKLLPSVRKSKGQKVCLPLSDKELVQEAEGSDLHALSPASDVDRTAAEITIEENNGTSVDKVLSEGLKESSDLSEPETTNTTEESDTEKKLSSPEEVTPEVPVTGFIQSKEEPDTERPQSPPEMVPTEVSEIKPHWDDWKPSSDLSDQETSTSRDSDGQRSPSVVESELESDGQEVAETAKEPTMEQEMVENTDKAPVPGQPEEGEVVPAPETSSALQRDTAETGISAAPACVESVTQAEVQESTNTVEEENTTPFMENNLPHLSSEPAGALNLSEYIDGLWKDTYETERRYLVLDVPEVSFSQTCDRAPDHRETAVEPSPEQDSEEPSDKDTSAAEAETEEDTAGVQQAVSEEVSAQTALLSEGRPNQEMMEPLETCPSEDVDVEEGNTPETGEEEADICMQREEAPEGEKIITADITLQEPSAEVKVQERGADAADDPLQDGSAESITPSEFIEISVYETSQIETSTEPLEVARISPAPLQEHQVREEPEILEENYVKMEKIEKGSEVYIFHQDAQASGEEEETMSVKITKEPTADVNLSIQFGKDLNSADVLPEMDTVELTVFGVTTEEQDLQEQGPVQGSEQVSEGERTAADLEHEEATGEEEHGPDQKQSFSSQSLTYLELKDEPDAHTEQKDEGESDVEVAPSDVYDAADSLAEQEPREESCSSLEMVGAGKDVPASEVPSDATVVMGEASDSPAPSAPPEQQVVDTQEKSEDQEENKKFNIPGQEKDTTEGEIVGLEPPIVQMGSTLEEIPSVESPQVRCHCIFARSHFQSQ